MPRYNAIKLDVSIWPCCLCMTFRPNEQHGQSETQMGSRVAQGNQHQYQAKSARQVNWHVVQQVAQGTEQQRQANRAQPAGWHAVQMLCCLFAHSSLGVTAPSRLLKLQCGKMTAKTAAQQHHSHNQQTSSPGFEVLCLGVSHQLDCSHSQQHDGTYTS